MGSSNLHSDLNEACNLVYKRTGLVPEVDTAAELTAALLEWGDQLAAENENLKSELDRLKRRSTLSARA